MVNVFITFSSSHKQLKFGRITGGEEFTVHPSLKEVFGILSPIIQLSSHNEFDPATCHFSALYLHCSGEVHLPMKVKLL